MSRPAALWGENAADLNDSMDQARREAESNSRPMSLIMSMRAESEDSDEIIEERLSRLYSVFFMALWFLSVKLRLFFYCKGTALLCQLKAQANQSCSFF